ncbi:MAG: 4Fe-4S binding protein [Candidatus Omnitrophota bacterium]
MIFDINHFGFFLLFSCAVIVIVVLISKRWIIPIRGFVQLTFLVVSEIVFFCNKGVRCDNYFLSFGVCPVGTAQRLVFIKTFPFYFTLGLIAVGGFLFGTLTCGWACPVGFLQDILHMAPVKKLRLPRNFSRFRYLALGMLAVIFLLEVFFHFFSKRGIGIFNLYFLIAGNLLLLVSIVIKRFFCKVLCPIGLIYGKLNKLSPLKVRLDKEHCKGCRRCSSVCVTGMEPHVHARGTYHFDGIPYHVSTWGGIPMTEKTAIHPRACPWSSGIGIKPLNDVNGDLCAKCFNCRKVCLS